MKIFGHYFDFQDEPVLRKEYGVDFSCIAENCDTVQVMEIFKYPDSFLKTAWIVLSSQEVRYLTSTSVKEIKEHSDWALEIKNIVLLIWDTKNKTILYKKGKNYTVEQLRFWLFHSFFPMVLEIEQIYSILHVGSVEIEGKPVLFSAFSFGGKSTMTDYFIQKGHTMLSDDTLAIDKRGEEYYAVASYPFHRPYREPEVLGYPVENFATEPKPLHAVYLLEKSEPDAMVKIEEVKGIEKFKAFHFSTFINFSFTRKRRFKFFMDMAKHVSVYRVAVPWDMERLEEVYIAIVQHVKA